MLNNNDLNCGENMSLDNRLSRVMRSPNREELENLINKCKSFFFLSEEHFGYNEKDYEI